MEFKCHKSNEPFGKRKHAVKTAFVRNCRKIALNVKTLNKMRYSKHESGVIVIVIVAVAVIVTVTGRNEN